MAEDIDTGGYIRIELDWVTYYNQFKIKHGLYPIKYKNRVLFEDGWMYSATELSGPEFPPPDDARELWKLQVAYWYHRRRIVKHERDYLRKEIDTLRAIQIMKDVPLQRVVTKVREGTNEQYIEYEDLEESLQQIENTRLTWLARDIDQCDEKLIELKKSKPSNIVEEREVQV